MHNHGVHFGHDTGICIFWPLDSKSCHRPHPFKSNLTPAYDPAHFTDWIRTPAVGCRAYCYAELAVTSPVTAETIAFIFTEVWLGWIGLGGGFKYHLNTNRARRWATPLMRTTPLYIKPIR